jgi:hypothetical protein
MRERLRVDNGKGPPLFRDQPTGCLIASIASSYR